MTTGDTGRLDRIEQILEGVSVRLDRLAVSQAETQASLEVTRAIADSNARAIADTGRRFDELLEEARADRQAWREQALANEVEHRAFTQNVQVLLDEIARIWQRLAG